jgi:hypothetical protein
VSAPFKVDDEVVVILSANLHRGQSREQRTRRGRITAIARTWLVIYEIGKDPLRARSWRMRIDTQREGNKNYSQHDARFLTVEQDERERAKIAAAEYLDEQGIDIRHTSPWHGREAELADLLKSAQG